MRTYLRRLTTPGRCTARPALCSPPSTACRHPWSGGSASESRALSPGRG